MQDSLTHPTASHQLFVLENFVEIASDNRLATVFVSDYGLNYEIYKEKRTTTNTSSSIHKLFLADGHQTKRNGDVNIYANPK